MTPKPLQVKPETIKIDVKNNIFVELYLNIFRLFLLFLSFADVKLPRVAEIIVHKSVLKILIYGKILKSRISGHLCLKPASYQCTMHFQFCFRVYSLQIIQFCLVKRFARK